MKSIFDGSAIATALLSGFLLVSASSSGAETLASQFPQSTTQPVQTPSQSVPADLNASGTLKGNVTETSGELPAAVSPPASYIATAYSLRGRTASGRFVAQGIIAADPRVLPLGSRVRLEAGRWSGEYLVADTGGKIKGRKIDIWTPSTREAMRFGRRKVKLTVLSYGAKRVAKKRVQI